MAEKRGRGPLVGCLVGCLALGLVGGAAALGLGVLGAFGAGGAAYFLTTHSPSHEFEDVARTIEDAPVPMPAPVEVPEVVVDGHPAADGSNLADMTGADGTAADGTATDGLATDGTATDGSVAPAPAPTGTADLAPAPAPVPSPVTTPSPSPSPSPAPLTRPSPSPSPSPVPAPMTRATGGKITVEGAATVVLIGADGTRYPVPGSVPSGSYQMEATFSDGVPVNVGKLAVEEGASHVVRCNENMGICRGS